MARSSTPDDEMANRHEKSAADDQAYWDRLLVRLDEGAV